MQTSGFNKTGVALVVSVVLALLAGALLAGCDDSPTGPESQNLTIMLTDDHTDRLQSVNVFVESLTVKRSGAPVEHDVPVVLASNPQDLLLLTDDVVPLAVGSLEPGAFEFIQVELDESRSSVVEDDGTEKSLRIPSEEIKIVGGFEIPEDGSVEIVLDFDVEASMVLLGNDEWLLRPQIVITSVDTDS